MPNDPILHLLGLAKKAGKLELGEEPVGALCRARHARLVLLADNAAPNTYRRAAHFGEAGNVLWLALPHSKEELGFYFGRGACAIMALSDAGFAATLVEKLTAMDPDKYGPAAVQLREKADRMLQRQREKRQHEKNLRTGKLRKQPAPAAQAPESEPKKKTHSERSAAPKSQKPGKSAFQAKSGVGNSRTAPSFRSGPGGRKLTGKVRKP